MGGRPNGRRRGRAGLVVWALSGAMVAASCGGGGDGPTATASTGPPAISAAQAMQHVLDNARDESGAPGALALVRSRGEEWFGTSGAADLDGSPISAATRFRIGSITKTVTSALVLDAVARGELSLDDTIQSWVPGVIADEPAITIRMLLAHTSGIFNVGDEGDVAADIARIDDPDLRQQAQDLAARYLAGEAVIVPDLVWIAVARTHPLYFEPGTGHHYSNVNYQLAAMALEAATGQDLASLVQERLAGPLGLSSIGTAPADLGLPDLRSYTKDPATGALVDTTTDLLALGNGGSGGIVSTAGDLLDLLEAIVSGDLLPARLRGGDDGPDRTVERHLRARRGHLRPEVRRLPGPRGRDRRHACPGARQPRRSHGAGDRRQPPRRPGTEPARGRRGA